MINNSKIKIKKEKEIVTLMIEIYCKGHKHLNPPCDECNNLIQYVTERIYNCPFIETKTYCSNCTIHCYKENMRYQIKKVMRYSGPRMIFHHPIMTIDHIYQEIKHKLKQ